MLATTVKATMLVDVWKYSTTTPLVLPCGCHSVTLTLMILKLTWHADNWAMQEPLSMTKLECWGEIFVHSDPMPLAS